MAAVSRLDSCPLCLSEMPGRGCSCPRCHYHPDRYNRAQDDVAMIFRLSAEDRREHEAPQSVQPHSSSSWFHWLWK